MKSRYSLITFLFFGIISFIVFDAINNSADSHTSGAPATRTGSPGDGGNTCRNCHSGPNPTTEPGLISSNIPIDGYIAGQTYTITATIARNGHTKFGFEISPQNITGTKLGTLIVTNSTEMQLVGTGKYITHKTAGVSGVNSRTWTFNWTAPVAGTGDVTFYGAFNVTNAMNNSSGDTTVLSTLLVSECVAPAQPGSISGPAVICSGSGILTYSVPAVPGATSYTWVLPGGWTLMGPLSETISVMPSSNGGTLIVTASNSCGVSTASTLTITIDQLSASSSSTDVSCNGGADGTATGTPLTGVNPFQYLWSDGQTTATATNLVAGAYDVTITDSAGCTASSTTIVNEPSVLQLATFVTDASCGGSDGTAGVNANGGTPSYIYEWNSVPAQFTQVAVNLNAGNYTVVVTDDMGCTATASVAVGTAAGPTATASNVSDVLCHDGNDGAALASVLNGTAPYTYQWSPAGGTDSAASNLQAGSYTVVVTDANGCTSSSSVLITEPSQIVLSTSSTDAGCGQPNGTATVIANGGVGGYDYLWNTIPVQTTTTATNLPAASYQVTVTDDNGCSMSATVGVSDVLGPALQIGPIENVSCFGEDDGSIMVFASGGSAPYTFQWSPSGGNDSIATNLIAGVYSVTVTDVGGCVGVLTQTISEPDLLVAQPGPNTAICNGESVLLGGSPVAFGGTPAYSYLWSPAGSLSSATDSMPVAMPTTNTVYTLIVTDGNGCSASAIVSVDVNAIPVMPVITANSDSLFSTTANAYQWYFNGNILNGATSQFYVPQQTGNYSVVITDGNACSAASTDFFFNFSSVGHLMDEGVIEVYPNPAGNSVSIRLLRNEEIEMHIVNLTGERFSVGIAKSSADFFTLDISALANGVYVLEIKFLSTNKISRKIIVKE